MTKNETINFGRLTRQFADGRANSITFCVTEECNLRCKYCYLTHKNNHKKMSFETAKKAVDYFLRERELYNEKSVIWDFIGGEPFLETKLIDKISDYIKEQMYLTNHPWFDDYMFSFTTNGLLYHTKEVQDYIKKNRRHISIGITVDGNKIKHDMQRVYPDGRGSYDDVVKNVPLWLKQFHCATKATFAHDDLPYLKDSIISLWNLGIKEVAANIVFEDVWEEGDPEIFEAQLKSLADYVIENDIFKDPMCTVRFFEPSRGLPMSPIRNKNKFCGSGKMVAVDCDGNLFPCIRFTGFSLNKQKPYPIGNIETGVVKDRVKPFKYLSIGKMNDEECNNCEVASDCMTCVGLCYDDSGDGTIFKKPKYNCEMHKANARAIEYFWNKVNSKLGNIQNPRELERELYEGSFNRYLIIYLNEHTVPHCRYRGRTEFGSGKTKPPETVNRALEFAKNNKFTPIFVGLPQKEYRKKYAYIVPAKDHQDEPNEILVYSGPEDVGKKSKINILRVDKSALKDLGQNVISLFEKNGASRVNIILCSTEEFNNNDLNLYKSELCKVADYILKSNPNGHVNVLNGTSPEVDFAEGCGCGVLTFAVMPNGKLYICPGFYFEDESLDVGDLKKGLCFDFGNELKTEYSKDCVKCSNFQCDRCVYLNKKTTNEYSISPDIQCKISDIEREIGQKLVGELEKKHKEEDMEMDNL